jgi:hypothetical protein
VEGLPPTARLLGIGFYVAICIAGGTGAGLLLDEALDTGKLLTILGLVLGLVMALWGGYLQLQEVLAEIARRQRAGEKRRE